MNQKHARHPKICFIALTAYPLLAGKPAQSLIGPDVHTVLLGRALAGHGFKVTFITYDEGGPPVEEVDGIEVIKTYRREDVPRLNRILKVIRIWRAVRKARASVYIHAGGAAGVISPLCRLLRKRFIYEIASDALVDKALISRQVRGFSRSMFGIDALGNRLDIKLADAIIVQSEFQKRMLKKNFGKDSTVIKMPFPLTQRGVPEKSEPPVVLWVGAMAEVKQPELLMKLAEALPEAKFQMVGGPSANRELYDQIGASARTISNLELAGFVPFDKVDDYFRRASILVNTSMFEGFPNSFIQAWMHYTPVVSLNSDPDEIICQHRLGFHSRTFPQLTQDVKRLLADMPLCREMGENGRRYVEENHDISNIIKQYIEVFNRLVKPKGDG